MTGTARPNTRFFCAGALLIVLLALLVRVVFLLGLEVQTHIAGDINDYVHYAWNLGQHGIYSSVPTDSIAAPAPDRFRPPGYPLFLLLAMWLGDFGGAWLVWAHALQILLSTATVLLTVLLGREWMRPAYALAAGALLALWPHHVVFASTLLSETLLGFCVILALWLTALAYRKRSSAWAVAAGFAFGFAALVNTLMLLLPFLVAGLLIVARRPASAFTLVLAFAVLPVGWLALGPTPVSGTLSGSDRAAMNLVQGSWPQYHLAWRTRGHSDISRQIMAAINDEVVTILDDRHAGLHMVGQRLAQEPARYSRWYLLEKPWLLWDWDIRLGWHGIHFLPTDSSPYERNPLIQGTQAVLKAANPALFALAGLSITVLLVGCARGRPPPFAAASVALFVMYVTFLHTVFQAEPRYAVPYRPEQLLLASMGVSILFARLAMFGRRGT